MLIRRPTREGKNVVRKDDHSIDCYAAKNEMHDAVLLILMLHKINYPVPPARNLNHADADPHRIGLTAFNILEEMFGSARICRTCFGELCSLLGPDAERAVRVIGRVPLSIFEMKVDNALMDRPGR